MSGIEIAPLRPGSPEWYSKMSASKVAAVLGLSPYDSRFSLYHRMTGEVEPDPQTTEQSRGHYLEPAIAAWFADQHPMWTIAAGGCWQHETADWYTASPDRLGYDGSTVYGVELKTDSSGLDWGAAGTDEIPPGIRAQVVSQMDVVGTTRTYIGLLSAYLEFREYVVDFDQTEADFIRSECEQFMADVANRVRPNLDDHAATYQTLRSLHPEIDPIDVDLSHELTRDFCTAKAAVKAAEANAQRATNLVADALGTARRGRYLDQTIVTRQAKGEGRPYLVASRSLPVFEESLA